MKRQLDTSSVPEQFESYKRLKVNPDLVSEEEFGREIIKSILMIISKN